MLVYKSLKYLRSIVLTITVLPPSNVSSSFLSIVYIIFLFIRYNVRKQLSPHVRVEYLTRSCGELDTAVWRSHHVRVEINILYLKTAIKGKLFVFRAQILFKSLAT